MARGTPTGITAGLEPKGLGINSFGKFPFSCSIAAGGTADFPTLFGDSCLLPSPTMLGSKSRDALSGNAISVLCWITDEFGFCTGIWRLVMSLSICVALGRWTLGTSGCTIGAGATIVASLICVTSSGGVNFAPFGCSGKAGMAGNGVEWMTEGDSARFDSSSGMRTGWRSWWLETSSGDVANVLCWFSARLLVCKKRRKNVDFFWCAYCLLNFG